VRVVVLLGGCLDGNLFALSLIPIVLGFFFITWRKHENLISIENKIDL